MTDKMAFVCDEVTPEMIALDEMLATDDLTDVCPVGFDEEEWVEITREITIDPSKYRSPNYQPAPGSIPQSEPDPDDDTSDDLPPEPYGQDEAIALDATLPCNTTFANCQAKNPLLCPYHGAKLIEADIKAGLAQAIPNAVVKVSAHKGGQAQGKNFSISIKVPASQKLAAEKALDDFLQQPGIKSQGMKDWDPRSNEWSDFYDVDLLQLNSTPQGGMANRAALTNSVGQPLSPQQPSQQQTTPAAQPAATTTSGRPTSTQTTASKPAKPAKKTTSKKSAKTQQSAAQQSQSAQQTLASTNGQQPVQGGYQPLSDVDDDRKFLTSMKGKAAANELQDLEDLIDEKEQLIDQIDATKLAMSNGDTKDAQMYQSVIDYASGGLKDVDEKVLEAKEALSNKYDSKECQPAGATCAQIKANLQAQGATFIPKALDNMEAVMQSKMAACCSAFKSAGLTEAANPATWKKICDLVEKSLANYLTKAAIRSYCSGDSPDGYFFSNSTGRRYGNSTNHPGSYYNNYGGDLVTDNYGVQSPKLKEFRLCASATDPNRSAWDSGQSDWCCDGCAFTIRKSNTFCAFTDYNTGGGHGSSWNASPISKPSILSIAHSPRKYVSWIRKMLQTGQPDMTYDRNAEERLTSNGHNEIHAFCGCDMTKSSEKILAHIESLEYSDKTDADTVVQKHAAELKQYGVKVYYFDPSTRKNVEINF